MKRSASFSTFQKPKKLPKSSGGIAPPDLEFDYNKTRPTAEELEKWARPRLTAAYVKKLDRKEGEFMFQLVDCKSSYVRPSQSQRRHLIHSVGDAQVPVVRLYGVTPEGHSVCINVWNFSPYIFIKTPNGLPHDQVDLDSLLYELDRKIVLAKKRSYENKTGQGSGQEYTLEELQNDYEQMYGEYADTEQTQSSSSYYAAAVAAAEMDPGAAEREREDRKQMRNTLQRSSSLLSASSDDNLIPHEQAAAHRAKLRESQEQKRKAEHNCIESLVPVHYTIGDEYTDKKTPLLQVKLRTPNLVIPLRTLIGGSKNAGLSTEQGVIYGPTCESGVRFETRFMMDHGLCGSGWVRLSGPFWSRRGTDVKQDSTCQIEIDCDHQEIQGVSVENEPQVYMTRSRMRIMYRDIEVLSLSGDFPVAEKDPVIVIHAIVAEVDDLEHPLLNVGFCLGSLPATANNGNRRILCFDNEYDLLDAYGHFIGAVDVDIESGFNTKGFDAPYLYDRTVVLGVESYLNSTRLKGRQIEKQPKFRESRGMGNRESWLCPSEGRLEICMMQFIQDNHKLSSYSLNAVSAHFLKDQKDDVSHKIIPGLHRGSREDRLRLERYCEKDTLLPKLLMSQLRVLPFIFEMTRVQGVQLAEHQDGFPTLKVFVMILTRSRLENTVVPYVPNQVKTWYTGANVFDPVRGFYKKPIVILDFFSLYPSEAIGHNLCFTTHVPKERIEEVAAQLGGRDKLETCPDGYTYVRASVKKGIIPLVQERLIKRRDAAKAEMAKATDSASKQAWSCRELALKIVNNSVYGWTGVPNNGVYNQHVSRSITAYGREQILKTRALIEGEFRRDKGYGGNAKVLYGDTDSVMVDFGIDIGDWESQDEVASAVEMAQKYAKLAADLCTKHFVAPNKLQIESIIMPFLLVNKKRYGGLLWSNPYQWSGLKIKGLECMRRNNCRHTRRTQEACLKILFERLDADAALEYARKAIVKLRRNQVDFYDLIITASLSKTSAEYKNPQAHAFVADLIKKRSPGSEPHIGDRVPYVIIAADKRTKRYQSAEDPMYALEKELTIDTTYYVEKQLMGPLERIFEVVFGLEETRRRLTSGDTNVRVVTIGHEKKGLLRYYVHQYACLECGTSLPLNSNEERGLLCAQCEPTRLSKVVTCQQQLAQVQHEYARVWTHCQNCQGSVHREVICDASDCPLFYKRFKLAKDVEKAAKQFHALSLDW